MLQRGAAVPGIPMLLAVGLALLSGSGCIIQSCDADCPAELDCESCLDRSGCGFCDLPGAEGGCRPGTSFGADEQSSCPDSKWRFSSCDEPPAVLACGRISGCSECVAAEGCGFCAGGMDCRDRDFALGCELEVEAGSAACRDADCRALPDCEVCAETEGCGFCAEDRLCHALDVGLPCELTTDPASFVCAAERCLSQSTCEGCLEVGDGCGWCLEAAECRHREASEDCTLELSSWSGVCEEARCRTATSCEECIAVEGSCEWCDLWDFCTQDDDGCPGEYSMSRQCPPPNECADHDDYGPCIEDPRCAWCHGGIYWQYESYSGCLVVDAAGEPYGDDCSTLLRTEAERPCAYRVGCDHCVESSECAYCIEGDNAYQCVPYSSSDGEPEDRYLCDRWYPPGSMWCED